MLNISFDFDETTQKVTNVKVKSSMKMSKSITGKAYIILESNKISLSDKAVELLNCSVGDRISINYKNIDNELTIPLIGKSEKFADKESGNKLTKAHTVSFRGFQHKVLSEYGEIFELEKYSDEVFKLRKNELDNIKEYEDKPCEEAMDTNEMDDVINKLINQ